MFNKFFVIIYKFVGNILIMKYTNYICNIFFSFHANIVVFLNAIDTLINCNTKNYCTSNNNFM